MDDIKEICDYMIRYDLDHVERKGHHIYHENYWIYVEGSTPIVMEESLEGFLDKIQIMAES